MSEAAFILGVAIIGAAWLLADAIRNAIPRNINFAHGEHSIVVGPPDAGPLAEPRMLVCDICGNKRCPHAVDDRNACTDSNEPGQRAEFP